MKTTYIYGRIQHAMVWRCAEARADLGPGIFMAGIAAQPLGSSGIKSRHGMVQTAGRLRWSE